MGKTLKKNARRKNDRINHKKQGYKPINKKTPKKYKKTKKRYRTTNKRYITTNKRYKKTLHARRHRKRTNMRKTRRMNKRTINKKIYYQDGGMEKLQRFGQAAKAWYVKKVERATPANMKLRAERRFGKGIVRGIFSNLLGIPLDSLDYVVLYTAIIPGLVDIGLSLKGWAAATDPGQKISSMRAWLRGREGILGRTTSGIFTALEGTVSFPFELVKVFLDPSERIGTDRTTLDELLELVKKLGASPARLLGVIAAIGAICVAVGVGSPALIAICIAAIEGTGLAMGINFFEKFNVEGMDNAPQFMKVYMGEFIGNFIQKRSHEDRESLKKVIFEKGGIENIDNLTAEIEALESQLRSQRADSEPPIDAREETVESLMNLVYVAVCLRGAYDPIESWDWLDGVIKSATEKHDEDAAAADFDENALATFDGASPMVIASLMRCIASGYHSYELNANLETVEVFKRNPDIASYLKKKRVLGWDYYTSAEKSHEFNPKLIYNQNVLGICDNAPRLRYMMFEYYKERVYSSEDGMTDFIAQIDSGEGYKYNYLLDVKFNRPKQKQNFRRRLTTGVSSIQHTSSRSQSTNDLSRSHSSGGETSGGRSQSGGMDHLRLSPVSARTSSAPLTDEERRTQFLEMMGGFHDLTEALDDPCDEDTEAISLLNKLINILIYHKYNRSIFNECLSCKDKLINILSALKTRVSGKLGLFGLNELTASRLDQPEISSLILEKTGLHKLDRDFSPEMPTKPLKHYKLRKILAGKIFCLCRLIFYGINENNNPALSKIIDESKIEWNPEYTLCCLNEYGIMDRYYSESTEDVNTLDVFEILSTEYAGHYIKIEQRMTRMFGDIPEISGEPVSLYSVEKEKLPSTTVYSVDDCKIETPGIVDIMCSQLKDLTVNTIFERQTDNTMVNHYIDKLINSRKTEGLHPIYFLNGLWVNDNSPVATRGIVKLGSEDPNKGMSATRGALHEITEKPSSDNLKYHFHRGRRKKGQGGGALQGEEGQRGGVGTPPLPRPAWRGDDGPSDEEDDIPASKDERHSNITKAKRNAEENNDFFKIREDDDPEGCSKVYQAASSVDFQRSKLANDRHETLIEDIVALLFTRPQDDYDSNDMELYRSLNSHYGTYGGYYWGNFEPVSGGDDGDISDNNIKRVILSREYAACDTLLASVCGLPDDTMGDLLDKYSSEAKSSCYTSDYLLHKIRIDECRYHYGREISPGIKDMGIPDVDAEAHDREYYEKMRENYRKIQGKIQGIEKGSQDGGSAEPEPDIEPEIEPGTEPNSSFLNFEDDAVFGQQVRDFIKRDVGSFTSLQKQKRLAEAHISLGMKEGWKVLSYCNRLTNGINDLIMSRMINIMSGSTGSLLGNLIESLTPTVTVEKFYTSTDDTTNNDRFPYQYISFPMKFLESILLIVMLDDKTSEELLSESMLHLVKITSQGKSMVDYIKKHGSEEDSQLLQNQGTTQQRQGSQTGFTDLNTIPLEPEQKGRRFIRFADIIPHKSLVILQPRYHLSDLNEMTVDELHRIVIQEGEEKEREVQIRMSYEEIYGPGNPREREILIKLLNEVEGSHKTYVILSTPENGEFKAQVEGGRTGSFSINELNNMIREGIQVYVQ